MKNYYKIMGVKASATDEELKTVYRQLAKRLHPDLHPGDAEIAARFADVNEAYEVLSDAQRRAAYDKQISALLAQKQAASQPHPPPQATRVTVPPQAQGARGGAFAYAQNLYGQPRVDRILEAQRQAAQNAYNKGFADAQRQATEQIDAYKRTAAACDSRARAAEEALKKAEDERARQVREMIARQRGNAATQELSAELQQHIQNLMDQLDREAESRRAVEQENTRLVSALERARGELETLRAQLAEWETYGNRRERDEELRGVIEDWQQKVKDDKKWLKGSLYGNLGVLFWATDDEIEKAYEKLKKRYAKKVLSGDEAYKQKLKEANEAYKTLKDPAARAAYNRTLEITEKEIADCRADLRNYEKALNELSENAAADFADWYEDRVEDYEAGDVEAATELGEAYYNGEGTERDCAEAEKWFRLAVEGGSAEAKYDLGLMHLNNECDGADASEGVRLIKEAAAAGCERAQAFEKEKVRG